MDQASRIIARLSPGSDLITSESIACRAWKKAVGKRLAGYTSALKLVRDRLVVEVEDEVWRSQLWALRFQILRNLDKAIGPGIVCDLEFRVMPPRREARRALTASGALEALGDEATGIEDPILRRNYLLSRARETA